MRQVLLALVLCFLLVPTTQAQSVEQDEMTPEQAQSVIEKTLTEDVKNASEQLNTKVDYIATRYDDNELKALIKNYEKINRKMAARQKEPYIPYDRKIDVNNPDKVKRYLRKRIDIIF